jgi:hypothetical protein
MSILHEVMGRPKQISIVKELYVGDTSLLTTDRQIGYA